MSHHYARRIARIPVLPPSPPRPITPDVQEPAFGARDMDIDMDSMHDFPQGPPSPGPAESRTELSAAAKGKGKAAPKRAASLTRSEIGDMYNGGNVPLDGPAPKRQKIDHSTADIPNGMQSILIGDGPGLAAAKPGKSQVFPPLLDPLDPQLLTKPGRKRGAPKRKPLAGEAEFDIGPPLSVSESTPAMSRQNSPAPNANNIVFELADGIPPLRKAKRTDEAGMLKRVKALEDAQRKVWTTIAKRDIVKVC